MEGGEYADCHSERKGYSEGAVVEPDNIYHRWIV